MQKKQRRKNILALMKKYFGKYKISFFVVAICAAISTVCTVFGPKILGEIITEIFNGIIAKIEGRGNIDFDQVKNILLNLFLLYIISCTFSAFQGFIMTNITQKITYRIRKDIIKKVNSLPLKYFEENNNGEILSILLTDIDTLSVNLNQSLTETVTLLCTMIGSLIMMYTISPQIAIITLFILPISYCIVGIVTKKSQELFKKRQDEIGHSNGMIEETYSGHTIIKAFNHEKKDEKEFEKINNELYSVGWKSEFLAGLIQPILNFMANIGYLVVAIIGGYLAATKNITVGEVQSLLSYNSQTTQPLGVIAGLSSMIQSMFAAISRISDFLEEKEEYNIESSNIGEIKGNIEFENVTFSYNENRKVIKNLSLKIDAGQKVAIVGPTGAGKTTIAKLLMRFYDLDDGRILIDGKDISKYNRHSIRSNLGMILQDNHIFQGTIKENIKFGNSEATDEQLIETTKKIKIDNVIQKMEKGYDTILGEETNNISNGEKQIITIARTMLNNPKILILDEATSSIDTKTEKQIQEAMDELMKGKTCFIIAHRISTIKNADLILVLNNGQIVEQGKHEDLLAKGKIYANLYNSQFI